jgi:hypothetical protein
MTTFTSEDRKAVVKDLEISGFVLRFVKQNDEWVCKMPEWLLLEAIEAANKITHVQK